MIDTINFWWAMLIWFVLASLYLGFYFYCLEKRKEKKEWGYTRKDILLAIIFFPLTVMFGVIFVIMVGIMKVTELLHFEDIGDWFNKPIRKRKKDEE